MAKKASTNKSSNPKGSGRKSNYDRMLIKKENAEQAVDFVFTVLENVLEEFHHDLNFPETFGQDLSIEAISKTEKTEKIIPPEPDPINNPIGTPKPKTRGILLLAMGHPNYGEMAANLGMSIKAGSPNMPIVLVTHGRALAHIPMYLSMFTDIITVPDEMIMKNGKVTYFKAKTHIYDLSPFDETIFLDVDTLWFQRSPITQMFEELKNVDFTIETRGTMKCKWFWGDMEEVKKKLNITNRVPDVHSEFIYFKKTAKNKIFFDKVKELYDNPPTKPTDFAGDIPDEYAFTIAIALLGHYPHQERFLPLFWQNAEKPRMLSSVVENFKGLSVGGTKFPDVAKRYYETVAKSAAQRVGGYGHHYFRLRKKKTYLPERQKL